MQLVEQAVLLKQQTMDFMNGQVLPHSSLPKAMPAEQCESAECREAVTSSFAPDGPVRTDAAWVGRVLGVTW